MSRLIDADKLKEAIEEEKDDNDYMCRLCLESIKEIIDEQQTVFDVDEVVRQIKDIKDDEYAQVKFGFYNTGFAIGNYNQGFYAAFS